MWRRPREEELVFLWAFRKKKKKKRKKKHFQYHPNLLLPLKYLQQCFIFRSYSGVSDYEVMLSVYFYWCVELGNDSDSPGLLLLKVPIFWRCAGSQSKHCAKAKYLDVIVPLRLATEHLSSSLLHSSNLGPACPRSAMAADDSFARH